LQAARTFPIRFLQTQKKHFRKAEVFFLSSLRLKKADYFFAAFLAGAFFAGAAFLAGAFFAGAFFATAFLGAAFFAVAIALSFRL
jgi:hypothetical protein